MLNLARRIGAVPVGGRIPPALRAQQWSAFFVLLIWAAADSQESHPVLDWLCGVAANVNSRVLSGSSSYSCQDAVRASWLALRMT
eukprot:7465112-Karenia_brevis.AAC.1